MTRTLHTAVFICLLGAGFAAEAQELDGEASIGKAELTIKEDITDEDIRDFVKKREEYKDDPETMKLLDQIQKAAGITEADIARVQGKAPPTGTQRKESVIEGNTQGSEPEFEPDADLAEDAYLKGDYETALKHYKELAKEGDPYAHLILGVMHQEGQAVEQDLAKARAYYQRAADYGDRRGQELAESLEIYMDETKIENSQEQYSKIVEEEKQAGAPAPEPRPQQKWDPDLITEGERSALPSVD